jgi:hypothetical protein
MNYILRPKLAGSYSDMPILAENARTAVLERRVEGVEVVDDNGQLYSVVEIERLAESETVAAD